MSIIRVFDFETTGMAPPCEVVEAGTVDLNVATMSIRGPYANLFGVDEMPPEVRAIHHISMDDVRGKPAFDWARMEQAAIEHGITAWAAHNFKFDGQWAAPALPVICTYKAALRVWPDAPSHGNQALRYWLEDQGLITIGSHEATLPPHRAGPDAYVTAHILQALLETGVTGKTMTGWTKLPAVQPRCKLGKHKGKEWRDVPTDYLEWIGRPTNDIDEDTKWNARQELDRRGY